jgi:hypothetical protein
MENEIKNYSNLSNTQKDFQMYLKNTGENYKTSKSYQFMSSFHKTSNQLYNRRARALILNPKNYDSDSLKQQLNNCKTMIHEQKATILNFKIKYGKLYNENMNNKNLISNVLGTPLEQYLTKEEVLDKIENVKLTKGERNILNEAYECILLKYEIEGKKERNKKLAKYLKELIDNSKVKKINEMVNEYLEKCEEQRKLLRKLKTIEEATNVIENENVILEQSLEKEKKTKNEIQKKKLNKRDNYEELIEERSTLSHQNKSLLESIKKTIKKTREKNDKIRLIETQLKELENNCQEIDEYKTARDSKIKKLDEKQLSDEEIRKNRKELENIIKQLNLEYEQLSNKMSNY